MTDWSSSNHGLVFPAIFPSFHSFIFWVQSLVHLCNRNQSAAAVWLAAGLLSNVAGSFLLALRAFMLIEAEKGKSHYEEWMLWGIMKLYADERVLSFS
jgi:hypothetical protein